MPVSAIGFRRNKKQSKSNIREYVTDMDSFVLKEISVMLILLNT